MGQEELIDSVKCTLSHGSLNPILHGLFSSTMDGPNSTLSDCKESLADKDLLVVGTNKQKHQMKNWSPKLITSFFVSIKTPKHFILRFNKISLLYPKDSKAFHTEIQ
jgi:hypothetical protein